MKNNILTEKNKPTNPKLWSKAMRSATSSYGKKVSAYKNGYAAKLYKKLGGKWRTVKSENAETPEGKSMKEEKLKNILREMVQEVMNEKCWDGHHHVAGTKPGEQGSCEKVEELDTQTQTDECWECYQTAMQEGTDEILEECYRTTRWYMVPDEDEHTCEGDAFYEIYGDIKYEEGKIEEAEYLGEKVKLNIPYLNKEYNELEEAKYHGRKVPLGKRMRGDVKKYKTYVRKPNGKIVKVNYGDKKMRIKKSNPKRRKSFRARHRCSNPGPRWKARYWSCKNW